MRSTIKHFTQRYFVILRLQNLYSEKTLEKKVPSLQFQQDKTLQNANVVWMVWPCESQQTLV